MRRTRRARGAGGGRPGWGRIGGLVATALMGAVACEESTAIGDAPTCGTFEGSYSFADECVEPLSDCTLTQEGCLLTVACEGDGAFRAWASGDVLEFYKGELTCRATMRDGLLRGDCGPCAFTGTPRPGGSAGAGGGGDLGGAAGTEGGAAGASPVDQCVACQTAQCLDPFTACLATAGCVDLAVCSMACTTDACRAECSAPPSAITPAAAYLGCVTDHCAAECGLTPSAVDAELLAAITRVAAADCDKLAACAPGRLDAWFGFIDRCRARAELAWQWEASLPGTGLTPQKVTACGEAWSDASCEEYLSSRAGTPAACLVSGWLDTGEACRSGSQCRSGYCATPDTSCGVCAPLPKLGGDCTTNRECNEWQGEWCTGAGQCALPGLLGDPCDDTVAPCDDGLGCVDGQCAALGTAVGDPCGAGANAPLCDWGQRLICNTSTSQCVAMAFVVDGAPCGNTASGYHACAASGQCDTNQQCVAGPADGEPCDETAGRYCTWPATCSSGYCVLPPSPGACP